MKTHRVYQFGDFRLDASAKVLLKDQEPVRLTRKAVETLLALVENCNEVRTKEELMQTVWPDRVVDEANLAQNIAVIRRALAVRDGTPGAIETFPGRGYRLVGPVASVEAPREASVAKGPDRIKPILSTTGWLVAGALILSWGWYRSRISNVPEQPHPVPVTRFEGKEYQAAVTADGQMVAFTWEREGEPRAGIWTQFGATSAQVSSRSEGTFASPAWSPDGRSLAYLRLGPSGGSIVVNSPAGGEERVLAGIVPTRYHLPYHHLDWSPDGQLLAMDDAPGNHHALSIFLVTVDQGERRRITYPDDLSIGDVEPRFSPDGKLVSFIRAFHRASQELFVVPAGGGKPVQLTSDGKQITSQDWMPDGKTLVYSSNRSGEFRLWKLTVGQGRAGTPRQTGLYSDFPLQFSIARRAGVLVYSVMNHDLNIWRLDLKTGADAVNRWTRVVASSAQDASPQYSPGGDKICFRSDRSGDEQLWIADSAGGNPMQITQGALRPSVGRWSRDGRTIVFNNALTREMFVARQGSNGSWSTSSLHSSGVHPVFSPDGRWIYAGTDDSIVRYPAQGGSASEVTRGRGISLDVSADGKYIYFVRDPAGTQLWRVETATGQAAQVFEGLVPYCSSCWALAPKGIYYLGTLPTAPDTQVLRFHDFKQSTETTLLDYPEPLTPLGSGPFSLSSDGRYLLCVRVDHSTADIFRVEPIR